MANSGVPDPAMRRTDLEALHPAMRSAAVEVLRRSDAENLGFRVFEAFRGPVRQNWLYQHGRGLPKTSIVTNAPAWSSYHQYGLGVDFVLFINNKWSWETKGDFKKRWDRLHAIGKALGLEPLSFELPHLQVAGLKIANLRAGKFPRGGDDSWRDNLEAAAIGWNGLPAAPPLTTVRPAIGG